MQIDIGERVLNFWANAPWNQTLTTGSDSVARGQPLPRPAELALQRAPTSTYSGQELGTAPTTRTVRGARHANAQSREFARVPSIVSRRTPTPSK
jgi:hypothetical protein